MEPSRRSQKTEETPENSAKTGFRKSLRRLWSSISFSDLSSPHSAFTPEHPTSHGLANEELESKSLSNLGDRRSNSPTWLNQNPPPAASALDRSSSFQLHDLECPPAKISMPSGFQVGLGPNKSAQLLVPEISISTPVAGSARSAYLNFNPPSNRLENFDKLKEILKEKLEKEEYEKLISQTAAADAQDIAQVLVTVFKNRTNAQVPESKQRTKRRTERALAFFEKAARIGDVAIQHHPDMVALAWAGFRTLLQIVVDKIELKRLLETAEEAIIIALEVCGFYEDIYITSRPTKEEPLTTTKLENAMIELYAAVIIFCVKSEKYINRASAINTLTAVNTELRSLVSDIETKGRLLQQLADISNIKDHRRNFEQLQLRTTEIQKDIGNILSDLNSMRDEIMAVLLDIMNAQRAELTRQQEEDLRRCRIWLGGLENDFEHEKNQKLHTTGTCEWILKHSAFTGWLQGKAPILLFYGIPGAGKSVLQSFILQKLPELARDKTLFPLISHFFFKNGNPKTESPITMVATLIDQLIQQHRTPRSIDLLKEARNNSNAQQCSNFKQLWNLFVKLVEVCGTTHGPLFVLIDALDECTDHSILSEFLDCVVGGEYEWEQLGVRFLFTSRPEDDIMRALKSDHSSKRKKPLFINLEGELISEDIRRFVKQQITPGTTAYAKLGNFREELIRTLPEKSQGMFRYAALMIHELLKPSTRDFEKTLNSIPSGLNSMYVWILEHLSDDHDDLLLRKTILTWLAMAFGPLTIDDLAFAYIAVQDDDNDDDDDSDKFNYARKVLINGKDIYRVCGPLVEVREFVSFSHFSVKEFLLVNLIKKSDRNALLNRGHLVKECLITNANIAHKTILRACLKQLLSSTFLTHARDTKLNLYIVRYWLEHARDAQSDNDLSTEIKARKTVDSGWQGVCRFLSESNPCYSTWLDQFPQYDFSIEKTCLFTRDRAKPLHIMACFNLYKPFMEVINNPTIDVDLRYRNGTPLSWAISSGHTHVVKLLLLKGADVNSRETSDSSTPLHRSAELGHTEVVKLLLENGANVESKNCLKGTPLSLASENGHTEVVELLLSNGADVECKHIFGMTPLLWASNQGHNEVVKLLLANGAVVECKDIFGMTPLLVASEQGHTEVVEQLLANGADMECKDSFGMTPLNRVFMGNAGEFSEMPFLDHGTVMERATNIFSGTLSKSTGNDFTEVVKLLLENGAVVESKDNFGMSPLNWASYTGSTEVAKLLLATGADIESRNNIGETPLCSAARRCNLEVVSLLLEKGGKVDAKNNDGKTPAALAAENAYLYPEQYPIVMKLLEDYGADTTVA